jgi:hypothetical protein
MPFATPNDEVRAMPAPVSTRPLVGTSPEPASVTNAMPRRFERGDAWLTEVSRRSTAGLSDAVDQLLSLQLELRSVIHIASERPWSEEERHRYHALARKERQAHRRFLAARSWFDDARTRDSQRSSPRGS